MVAGRDRSLVKSIHRSPTTNYQSPRRFSLRENFAVCILRPTRTWHRSCATHRAQRRPASERMRCTQGSAHESGDSAPRTIKRDRMTRIGFAYNQKPEEPRRSRANRASRASDEEPPSTGRDDAPRHRNAPTALTPAPRPQPTISMRSGTPRRRSTPSPARSLLRRSDPPRGDAGFPRAPPRGAARHRLQHRRRARRPESRSARPGDLRILRRSVLGQRSVHALALPRQGAHERDSPLSRRADRAVRRSSSRRDDLDRLLARTRCRCSPPSGSCRSS